MIKINILIALSALLIGSAQAGNVTSISIPVGGTVHVTVLQNSIAVASSTITWTSNGPAQIATITSNATGFDFVGMTAGRATAIATHSGDNATGSLSVTVTSAIAPLTFTSP